MHRAGRQRLERDRTEQLSSACRAVERDRDLRPVARGVRDDRPVHRRVVAQLRVGRAIRPLEHARVECSHCRARALEHVVDGVAAAERLSELIDDVRARGCRAPGIVRPAADLRVEAEAGERDASYVETAAVQVHLHQDLGRVIADLRAGDEDRTAGRRAFRTDEQRVRHHATVYEARVARDDRGVAAGVDAHVPGADARRPVFVRERLRRRDGSLLVELLAQVVPRGQTLGVAEPLLERGQELRAPCFLPAARAEHGAEQRSDRRHVVARQRRHKPARRLEVRVDAEQVRVDVFQQLSPLRCPRSELRLLREERLRRRARDERARRERDGKRVVPRDVERCHARRAAQQLEIESAVLSRRPACAELRTGARLAVDVRHVLRVAIDRHVGARMLDANGLRGAEAERLRLVKACQVGGSDVAAQRGQPVVERDLARQLRQILSLARRKDVEGDERPVARSGGTRAERDRAREDGGKQKRLRRHHQATL